MSEKFHPTAVISPGAEIDSDVEVGPYALIEKDTRIESGCVIASHAIIRAGTHLKRGVHVDSFAVIGGDAQSVGIVFSPVKIRSGVVIGEGSVLREGVTINRATVDGAVTEVGARSFLMAYSHVAHDCKVGHSVIMANNVLLAGHVQVDPYSFLGGGAAIHQFVCVGESVMVGGCAAITRNIPPFLIVSERDRVAGLNTVGLKRRQFPAEVMKDLKDCYHAVYGIGNNTLRRNAEEALANNIAQTDIGRQFLAFFQAHEKRGFVQREHLA